jgi:hypothetical protein
MNYKGWLSPGDFINNDLSLFIISFPPEFPVTGALRVPNDNKVIFCGLDVSETCIGRY